MPITPVRARPQNTLELLGLNVEQDRQPGKVAGEVVSQFFKGREAGVEKQEKLQKASQDLYFKLRTQGLAPDEAMDEIQRQNPNFTPILSGGTLASQQSRFEEKEAATTAERDRKASKAKRVEDKTTRKKQFRTDLADAQERLEAGEDEEDLVRALKVKYPGESLDINRVFNQRGVQGEGEEQEKLIESTLKKISDANIRGGNKFSSEDAENFIEEARRSLKLSGMTDESIEEAKRQAREALPEKEPGFIDKAKDLFKQGIQRLFKIGDTISRGGQQYTVVAFDDEGEPLVEPVNSNIG
ncbi:MAG: hypothetical protein IIC67_01070 [Thaumarchaeota archaeon]|nr:hypothetical protein [Nitrososphaerota archaeon]